MMDETKADAARAAAAGLADYADNSRAMPNERAARLLARILDYIDAAEVALAERPR